MPKHYDTSPITLDEGYTTQFEFADLEGLKKLLEQGYLIDRNKYTIFKPHSSAFDVTPQANSDPADSSGLRVSKKAELDEKYGIGNWRLVSLRRTGGGQSDDDSFVGIVYKQK